MSDEIDPKSEERKRVSFSAEEDNRVWRLVAHFGESDWARIADKFPKRDRRRRRERGFKYLAPTVQSGPSSRAEEDLLRRKVDELGCRWTSIPAAFPRQTDINIKNR
jgi:hypothetical protein